MASPMARLQQKTQAAVTTGSAGTTTGTPGAMVLRFIRALPGCRAWEPPSLAIILRTWPQRREVRTTRFYRPHRPRPSRAAHTSIASRTQRSWRSRSAPLDQRRDATRNA